jgi:hypothetical protein
VECRERLPNRSELFSKADAKSLRNSEETFRREGISVDKNRLSSCARLLSLISVVDRQHRDRILSMRSPTTSKISFILTFAGLTKQMDFHSWTELHVNLHP